ncbi:MAG: class I SAM-dependent methyltransferase, partial [Desulfuromonadales bacterium]|nr:class I SAM-dependent methyltransferase [Desulfuromonadales bacterium]
MSKSTYNFERCKLCGKMAAEAAYKLVDATIYACKDCNFHFLDCLDAPPDSDEDGTKLNQNSRAYIDARRDENLPLHQHRLNFVLNHLDVSNCQALDIGAGLGQFQLQLTQHGAQSYGIEPSSLRREYAQEKFAVALRPELVDHHYWQDGFKDFFDLITLWDIIEHVNFPRETLDAAIKLLKPGGRLFLDTPSREMSSYRLSQLAYRYSGGKISLFLPNFYSTNRYGHKQIF